VHEHSGPEIQEGLVIEAAKLSNIHQFITGLSAGYQTQVGQRGLLLSGGQKQRIAISRAVISDPKILLLDEATSALDTTSEGIVQIALNAASKGRTTIIIAHRLSTIKHADNIVVMSKGAIVEQGTHDELIGRKSAYHDLVLAQEMLPQSESNEDDEIITMKKSESRRIVNEKSEGAFKEIPISNEINRQDRQTDSTWRLLKLFAAFNSKEWYIIIIGLVFSILAGGTYPTQSVFFAKSLSSLMLPPSKFTQLRREVNFWAWMYFMLGIVVFINLFIQGVALGYCSSKLTSRVGSRAFRDILRQDVSFFDRDENAVGHLTSLLSTEPTSLAGFGGSTLGAIVSVITTIIIAVALSVSTSWKFGLVCSATVPFILACGFYRFWIVAELAKRSRKAFAYSASYAAEAISATRTIASLTRETEVLNFYHDSLVEERHTVLISTLKSANLYALSQAFPYLVMALGYWYGGHLISMGEIGIFEFYLCYNALIFTIQSAGRVLAFAPELGKATNAARELKALFDCEPVINSNITLGDSPGTVVGKLEFRDVHFKYATRDNTPVLRGLNFTVNAGQYVAIAGASGCGKSTVLALLERFYDTGTFSYRLLLTTIIPVITKTEVKKITDFKLLLL
jgi:ATP-binding cassette subfamily B (MDR/TAP) protein 1